MNFKGLFARYLLLFSFFFPLEEQSAFLTLLQKVMDFPQTSKILLSIWTQESQEENLTLGASAVYTESVSSKMVKGMEMTGLRSWLSWRRGNEVSPLFSFC